MFPSQSKPQKTVYSDSHDIMLSIYLQGFPKLHFFCTFPTKNVLSCQWVLKRLMKKKKYHKTPLTFAQKITRGNIFHSRHLRYIRFPPLLGSPFPLTWHHGLMLALPYSSSSSLPPLSDIVRQQKQKRKTL